MFQPQNLPETRKGREGVIEEGESCLNIGNCGMLIWRNTLFWDEFDEILGMAIKG